MLRRLRARIDFDLERFSHSTTVASTARSFRRKPEGVNAEIGITLCSTPHLKSLVRRALLLRQLRWL
jgi:hypothetical protein